MSKFHRKTYSESFKLEVLRDYYVSGLSMNSTAKKWGLTSNTYISRWQKCYPIDSTAQHSTAQHSTAQHA